MDTETELSKLRREKNKIEASLINYAREYDKLAKGKAAIISYIKDRKEIIIKNKSDEADLYSQGKIVGQIKELDLILSMLNIS